MPNRFDVAIVGAGVIGLSIAYVLSKAGAKVIVIDRGPLGREASWAGAGILPPANATTALHPYDQLRGLSVKLHAEWAAALRDETGIDNGFRRCGGLYIARTWGEAAALAGFIDLLREEQIEAVDVKAELRTLEPQWSASDAVQAIRAAWLVPAESQLRNPRHLAALAASGRKRGVVFSESSEVRNVTRQGNRLVHLIAGTETVEADRFCFCGGAWTGKILEQFGVNIAVIPIRGQMVLFRATPGALRHIVNEGPRYLVPRDDGFILAGSTEEEAGFDKSTTAEAIDDLIGFAGRVIPELNRDAVERTWAGLRPGTFDGMPYLGRIPECDNGFVAAGHFRSGLYLSPATAVMMSQMVLGQVPEIDLQPFRIGRG